MFHVCRKKLKKHKSKKTRMFITVEWRNLHKNEKWKCFTCVEKWLWWYRALLDVIFFLFKMRCKNFGVIFCLLWIVGVEMKGLLELRNAWLTSFADWWDGAAMFHVCRKNIGSYNANFGVVGFYCFFWKICEKKCTNVSRVSKNVKQKNKRNVDAFIYNINFFVLVRKKCSMWNNRNNTKM